MEELASLRVKPQLVWALSPALPMEGYIMFGPVNTTEAHLANTAELLSIIEALSFLGPNGPVARDSQACIFYDSKHTASTGTLQSRANVPLGLTSQRLLPQVRLKLRITVQHVCSHAQNLGNECAGIRCRLNSEHTHTHTRWVHSPFNSFTLFAACGDLDEALQVLRNARNANTPVPQRMVRS